MKAYTSRARFDEGKNFTGVYQQMGRVSVDADWNEEVQIRTTDARRRTSDLAHGSPDDGFSISDEHVVDRITGVRGWTGSGLEPGDLRVIPAELGLDRREPEGLPWVIRARGHLALERRFEAPVDLTALPLEPADTFAAAALVFSVRFERPANDDDPTDVAFFLVDANDNRAEVAAAFGAELPERWTHQRIPVAAFAGVDPTRIRAWGVRGVSPRALTWIDGLRATDAALAPHGADFVVRGGDGTIAGAGRMLVEGLRAYLARDVRYSSQPDLPDPPALAPLADGGTEAHVVYLDVWEEMVTALDDPFLQEPALDGLDTTVRLRLLTQIKVLQRRATDAPLELPRPTGAGRLTTNVPAGALPDRYPGDPIDPCRDRCLFTESASVGEGYTGAHNLHLRVEVFSTDGPRPVFLWSRDNGSTRIPLLADAPADATTLAVSGEDALRLRAGDVVVVSDGRIDRQPEGPRRPVLRVVRSADPATGTVLLREGGFELASDPASLVVGGPLGTAFAVVDRAYLRRWDGADWLLEGVRYNLPDGIALAFSGADYRPGEYWSFTARIENADGAARGVVEQLSAAPVHGPVHRYVPLARLTRDGDVLQVEDLRPRFLPLGAVRDRLRELATANRWNSAFTLVVGDGARTFGDIDQDLTEGVTGDEALQSAVNRLRNAGGGTLYVRAGDYRLEKPVLVSGCSRLRILGDGEASALRVVGAGGAFLIDACGDEGELGIEMLSLVEAPLEASVIGADAEALPAPGEEVEPLAPGDLLRTAPAQPSFAETVAASMLTPAPLARRALNAVRATLEALRRLQRDNPGQPVESLPAAAPLLAALRQVPHGVVTVGDSRRVTLQRLRIESREPQPEAAGIFVTGTCAELSITDCHIEAAAGVVAVPLAPYLARGFLARNARSGLFVDGLRVRGNLVRPRGTGTHGIHLADGVLRRIELGDNDVAGFAVGITVRDRLDSDAAATSVTVADNRISGFTGLGLDLVGRGVDVVGNALASGPPAGLVQAGIRLRGADLRVRDCDLSLRATGGASSPLGLIAAIVVGSGVDDGAPVTLGGAVVAVQDVEIAGCRIRGAGAAHPGIGVLVGGPEPILGVRVRDCDVADLGDAAVRVWGHGGKVGRIRIDDNRIERVALAEIPARTDTRAALTELSGAAADELARASVDLADPRALLEALVASPSAAAIAPIDGVLRWLSLRTLRGAVIFDQVQAGEITSNRIDGVGLDQATRGADVYTAGVAVIGGLDVAVEHNRVDNVLGEAAVVGEPEAPAAPGRPAAFATLEELEVAADDRRADRADVHLAATVLRRMILAYGAGDDGERQRIGRRIYVAMDALVTDLDALGGTGAKLAASLALEADEMRTAQGRDAHTRASNRVRATLSRSAAFTAHSDRAEEAWHAATQLDLAVISNEVAATAARLQDAVEELTEGLPERRGALEAALAAVVGAPADLARILAAAGELGTLAEWRDAADRRGDKLTPPELLGPKRTVVTRFAERLEAEAERLSADTARDNRAVLDALHADKQALLDALRGSNDDLARMLEVDWRSLERSVTAPRKERLQSTLAGVRAWAAGSGAAESTPGAVAHDVDRLGDAGTAALASLVAKHIDGNVARLSVESEGMKTKSLRVLKTAAGQLRSLVDEDPDAAELAARAAAAIDAAADDAPARASQLATARTFLDAIRRRAELLVPPPGRPVPPLRPTQGIERELAALAAAALALRSATGEDLAAGVRLYRGHFARALDAARVSGAVRATAVQAVNGALDSLASGPSASARERAAHILVRELDRVLGALPHSPAAPGIDAVVILVRAAGIGLAPGDDAATRLLRVQAYLREHAGAVSQSVHAALARQSELAELLRGLQAVLERLARGERPFVPELPPARFDRRLAPADGVFAAAPIGRLRIAGNQIQHAVRGITLSGRDGHPLIGVAAGATGLVAQLADNRLDGCVLGGLDLRPAGDAALAILDNEVFASAGVAEAGPDGIGQCVAFVRGRGELIAAGNSFHGNGHAHPRALVHEVVIDWRGDAVIRGNTVRHGGGGAGGAGLLVVAESSVSDLPRRLATAPFLGIEPPPARPREAPQPPGTPPLVPTLPILGNLGLAPLARGTVEQSSTGRLVQTIATARIAPRLITAPAPPRPTGLAATTASHYLDRATISPLRAILDFVRPWEYWKPLPLPPPAEQRTVHLEGNDVSARGPALLLIADERGDLLSTSVVGNGLHSEGGTGAAYVRFAESVVFTGNRCQAPEAVNVVVIRALDSAVSVTGNVVIGREPVAPPKPPIKPPRLQPAQLGPATLTLNLGGEANLSVPVDPVKLRGNLEAFSTEAQRAFANVLLERARAEEPSLAPLELREVAAAAPAPEGGATPEGGAAIGGAVITTRHLTGLQPTMMRATTAAAPSAIIAPERVAAARSFGAILELGAAPFALSPFSGAQPPDTVLRYIEDNQLGSREVEALMRGTDLRAFESDADRQTFVERVDLYRKTKKLEEVAAARAVDTAVERAEAGRVFQRVTTQVDTQAGALAEMTRLFTAQGFDAVRTTAEVNALLDHAQGDALRALGTLKTDILATDAATLPARKVLDNAGLLEKILADGLIRGGEAIAEPEEPEPQPTPARVAPDPHAHSLVVLGGAAVAAVGNATTAGALVLDAGETVELNL